MTLKQKRIKVAVELSQLDQQIAAEKDEIKRLKEEIKLAKKMAS